VVLSSGLAIVGGGMPAVGGGLSVLGDFSLGTLTGGAPIVERHSFSISINGNEYVFSKLLSNDSPSDKPSKCNCILVVPLDVIRNSVKADPTAYISQISSGVLGLLLKYSRLGSEDSRIASEMARE